MNEQAGNELRTSQIVAILIFVQLLFTILIVFDIPVARQLVGFVYLTFVPGYAILGLLRLRLGALERLLFAVGLSITFVMGAGLLMNLASPILGVSTPLSLIPLLLVVTVPVFLLLLAQFKNRVVQVISVGHRKLAVFIPLFCGILMLSVAGTSLVNSPPHDDNVILLLMLVFIAALVGLAAVSRKLVPVEFYAPALFVIALALLLHVSLFSSYIHGGDIFGEYSSFMATLHNSYWNSAISGRLDAMLSVTIFPSIYSILLGFDGTSIFKIVYPLIFALVPVGLYQLFKSRMSKEVAFFSVFFFVSLSVFFNEVAELSRQIMGELFYVLLFLTIFSDDVKGSVKLLLFSFFSFGLVTSHYAMSYFFLGFLVVTWLFSLATKRRGKITLGMILLFAVTTFLWYIYIAKATTFDSLVTAVNTVGQNFVSDFFNPQSRGSQVLQATGVQGLGTFWHLIGRYVFYATELLVVIGVLVLIVRQNRAFFNDDYNVFVFLNLGLVFAAIIVPNLASTFNATRFYQVALLFLAPCCVIGGINILGFLSKKRIREKTLGLIIVLIVLIPFFLFQTGLVYEMAKEESYSIPLSFYRFSPLDLATNGILTEAEVSGATWLASHADLNGYIYGGITSGKIFTYVEVPSFILLSLGVPASKGSYIFLGQYNLYYGRISTNYGLTNQFNITQIDPPLNNTDLIYNSGYSAIYKAP